MLTITATNFGVAPADIHIKEYHENNLMVLDGEFTVDTTDEDFGGIRPMQLTVADLPFSKSRVSTAIVTTESDGVKYATLTKVWISDLNTINIAKVLPYKSAGSYTVRLSTMLIPEMITGNVHISSQTRYVPVVSKGSASSIFVTTVQKTGWMMLALNIVSLTFDDTDKEVAFTLPYFPSGITAEFPVFYNEGLWVALGSKYYSARLQNGVITISKGDNADEASNAGKKFTRIFIVR